MSQNIKENVHGKINDEKSIETALLQLDSLKIHLQRRRAAILKVVDSLTEEGAIAQKLNEESQRKIQLLNAQLDGIVSREVRLDTMFVKKHNNSTSALDILYYRSLRRPEIPVNDLIRLFSSLPLQIQKSSKGKRLKRLLTVNKSTQPGCRAAYFDFEDTNGHTVAASSLKHNKYILLDFWASWCVPCIQEFPYLKKLSKKYHSKLDIVTISIDQDTSAAIEMIRKIGIGEWQNGFINDEIRQSYYIPAIPMTYLINNEGLIAGRWRGGGCANLTSLMKDLKSDFNY